jgi:hypothetical protein
MFLFIGNSAVKAQVKPLTNETIEQNQIIKGKQSEITNKYKEKTISELLSKVKDPKIEKTEKTYIYEILSTKTPTNEQEINDLINGLDNNAYTAQSTQRKRWQSTHSLLMPNRSEATKTFWPCFTVVMS